MEYIEYLVKIEYDDKTEIKPFYFNYLCNKCNTPVKEYTWERVREVILQYLQKENCSISVDDIIIMSAKQTHISNDRLERFKQAIYKPIIINCSHDDCNDIPKEIKVKQKVCEYNIPNGNKRIYVKTCKACIVCGEPVALTENEDLRLRNNLYTDSKICDKCKEAILYVRNNGRGLKESIIIPLEDNND